MAQVVLQDVAKVYDNGFEAVKQVCLEVADREFMVIVGPSGCGKTTTLRMIAGLEDISGGTIAIGDRVVNDISPRDRDIAMVFQNYALYPHMTVYQNMAFGLKLRKYPKSKIKQTVQQTAEMLGIESQLNKKPKVLSGGQRQRVALGRAIVREPAAFLFDEPLSNLDAKLRVTTRAELKSLHHRLQTTSIYVTHDQAEAMTLGDRICVMHEGRIQQVAEPMEVYDRPVNRFVAGFLGTPPMNFFDGKLFSEGNKTVFKLDESESISLSGSNGKLDAYAGSDMVLGFRPEHLIIGGSSDESENVIVGGVDVVEPLGDRKEVRLTSKSGQKFIANLDPHLDIKMGETVRMCLDIDKVHVFEPGELGKNVTLEYFL